MLEVSYFSVKKLSTILEDQSTRKFPWRAKQSMDIWKKGQLDSDVSGSTVTPEGSFFERVCLNSQVFCLSRYYDRVILGVDCDARPRSPRAEAARPHGNRNETASPSGKLEDKYSEHNIQTRHIERLHS